MKTTSVHFILTVSGKSIRGTPKARKEYAVTDREFENLKTVAQAAARADVKQDFQEVERASVSMVQTTAVFLD